LLGENGMDLRSVGLIAITALVKTPSVCPSGVLLAIASPAASPALPGRFSTTSG